MHTSFFMCCTSCRLRARYSALWMRCWALRLLLLAELVGCTEEDILLLRMGTNKKPHPCAGWAHAVVFDDDILVHFTNGPAGVLGKHAVGCWHPRLGGSQWPCNING